MIGSLSVVLALLSLHYLGDYVFQTGTMAREKANSIKVLVTHGILYTLCVALPFFNPEFVIITFCTHTLTDMFTSQIVKHFRERGEHDWMFKTIGFDQLFHFWTLVITAKWAGVL